ncbi:MAG TPA: imidazolonepropionase [Candidatus Limnocylindrales bacterium]|nr:imidazolonepropionase [Candidatus Limnocylindrales bacterium]
MTAAGPVPRPRADLVLTGATEVLTVPPDGGLGVVPRGEVAISSGRVVAVATRGTLARTVELDGARVIELDGGVVAPGYVDAHTHVVFGGSRVAEYAARVARDEGLVTRLREAGEAGIPATVAATRSTPAHELVGLASARVAEMIEHGTTTVESKSGYGLTTAAEIALLEVNRAIAASLPVRVVSTFLGAHDVPAGSSRAAYVSLVVGEMIPEVASRGLAAFCDVYCDEGYFDPRDARRILEAGMQAGLRPKIHLDAYSHTGAAAVAADLGVVSADHLNALTVADAVTLAQAGVVGVGLPGLDFAVGHDRPVDLPALRAAGMEVALATDICPACWMTSMTLVVQLACRRHGLSIELAIRAATRGGARALGLGDEIGSLSPGYAADLQVWDLPDHRYLAYRLGSNPVVLVVHDGRIVVDRRRDRLA